MPLAKSSRRQARLLSSVSTRQLKTPVTPKTSQITSGGTVQQQRDRLLISSPPVIGEPHIIFRSTDREHHHLCRTKEHFCQSAALATSLIPLIERERLDGECKRENGG